jgi:hypothetical protein
VDIAPSRGAADPGSVPARVKDFFREIIAMLLYICTYIIDLIGIVCVLKKRNSKGIGPKILQKQVLIEKLLTHLCNQSEACTYVIFKNVYSNFIRNSSFQWQQADAS